MPPSTSEPGESWWVSAPVTAGLLVVLGVVFLLQQLSGDVTPRFLTYGPAVQAGQWYRVVTGAFLHDGLLHVGFNGYLLLQLGRMLEPGLGRARFLGLYLAGLAGGAAGVILLSFSSPTLGASGAVFGLMGATMVLLRRKGINPWRTSIGTLVLLNLGITFVLPGVSIGGHVGGLLAGAGAAGVLAAVQTRQGARPRDGVVALTAVWVSLLAIAVALGMAGI